jgi:hypothetical protein
MLLRDVEHMVIRQHKLLTGYVSPAIYVVKSRREKVASSAAQAITSSTPVFNNFSHTNYPVFGSLKPGGSTRSPYCSLNFIYFSGDVLIVLSSIIRLLEAYTFYYTDSEFAQLAFGGPDEVV